MKASKLVENPEVAAFLARGERETVPVARQIILERSPLAPWILVLMYDGAETDQNELFSRAWESLELALCDADALKQFYGPAVIIDRTGGAA
ncbi:MAG: hypothetical protein EOS36_14920 [Mesorhizobium sp.]|uniref:hypothetical protein n=1 Tax=Mesorhizobium sp. TaxID=1871066 RepID=UPI000FE78229|nr:hypothetical protein [Mesorhizobium sp.]RWD62552.1 MAG: hypothetical protein EOS36_14920 [Mesorhizobium sp.]RWE39611.1 MAG: hypothetical protein EOS79_20525 [Mesorhizobium sp.]